MPTTASQKFEDQCSWQVEVKSAEDIEGMRAAGRVAREVLDAAGRLVAPGVTTDAIDALVTEETIKRGAYPSPLNLSRLPQVVLHLCQRGDMPRHP